MRVFKKILFVIFSLVDIYLLYSWIGYLVLGTRHPKIYGVENTTFTGMYMMSITFFVLFAILTTILVICLVKYLKNRKK
ncbi:MAG: hypothetical protein E7354_03810 [Clostridiales bacterium]|nr:hypothetical protein [Clostridiales bacterium]